MKFFIVLINIFFVIHSIIYTQSVFIIVHGTWSAESSWYMPKGDFFEALEKTVYNKNSSVVSFRWSGGCGHESRVKAANNLAKLIKTYDEETAVYVIAHSHGGNVATLASQILAQENKNKYYIRGLFALGTPIMGNYQPNMNSIYYIYNLFSFEDLIQTILGLSGREFPEHRRIANLRVMINGKEPDHAGLHHPLIGKWIPYLHHYFKEFLTTHGIHQRISEPCIVCFSDNKNPEYMFDTNRNELLDKDRRLSLMILNSLRDSSYLFRHRV